MVLITVSVCATVCVLNIHFRTPSTHSMPVWFKRWCVEYLPKYLFVNVPQYQTNQQTYILPEQLIYPHNQAYLGQQPQNQQPSGQDQSQRARSTSAASGWPVESQTTEGSKSRRQDSKVKVKYGGLKQLNPNSLDIDAAIPSNALSVSHSSLFLPYLQSEAARRLQMQRSRSSDRDQKSSSDNQNQQSQVSSSNGVTCDNQIRNDTSISINMPRNVTSTTEVGRGSSTRMSRRVSSESKSEGKSSDHVRSSRKSILSWLSSRRRRSRGPLDGLSGSNSRVESRRKSSAGTQQHSESRFDNDSSSSLENDYQYHVNFQARASICSTNMWRVGPSRLTVGPVAPNYPTYYRPIVQLAQSRRTDSDGRLNSQILELNSSISEASSRAQRPIQWSNQQHPEYLQAQCSQLIDAETELMKPISSSLLISGAPSNSVHLSAAARYQEDPGFSRDESDSTPMPTPPPPLPLCSSAGLGLGQPSQYSISHQRPIYGFVHKRPDQVILNPSNLVQSDLHSDFSGAHKRSRVLTTTEMMMMPPKQRSSRANPEFDGRGFVDQRYQRNIAPRVVMMPRSRSTDTRLSNLPQLYSSELPSSSGYHETMIHNEPYQTTTSNSIKRTPYPIQASQNWSDSSAGQLELSARNPLSIGRALGQAYVQRLSRQPTIYSMTLVESPHFHQQSRPNLFDERSSQRGQTYMKSFDSLRYDRDQNMRRSKSQGSLNRPTQAFESCPQCDPSYRLVDDNVKESSKVNRSGPLPFGTSKPPVDCCYPINSGEKRSHFASGCHRQVQHPIRDRLALAKLIYEVDKAIQNAMFIAQHIDNLDEFESVSNPNESQISCS